MGEKTQKMRVRICDGTMRDGAQFSHEFLLGVQGGNESVINAAVVDHVIQCVKAGIRAFDLASFASHNYVPTMANSVERMQKCEERLKARQLRDGVSLQVLVMDPNKLEEARTLVKDRVADVLACVWSPAASFVNQNQKTSAGNALVHANNVIALAKELSARSNLYVSSGFGSFDGRGECSLTTPEEVWKGLQGLRQFPALITLSDTPGVFRPELAGPEKISQWIGGFLESAKSAGTIPEDLGLHLHMAESATSRYREQLVRSAVLACASGGVSNLTVDVGMGGLGGCKAAGKTLANLNATRAVWIINELVDNGQVDWAHGKPDLGKIAQAEAAIVRLLQDLRLRQKERLALGLHRYP